MNTVGKRWVIFRTCLLWAAAMFTAADDGATQEKDLARFQADLSTMMLGNSTPVPDGDSRMHLGMGVVPPGEAWSLTAGEDEFLDQTPWGTSALATQFNYPVEVRGGIASVRRHQRLEKTWQRLLAGSVPETGFPERVSNLALFRPPDRVDEARGAAIIRQPSQQYLRYQEFKAALRALESAVAGNDNWRFHPRFRTFTSLEEARTQTSEDWLRFGYKFEIEAALREFENALLPGGWRAWLSAKTVFETNTIESVPGIPSGRTWFFPSEKDWQNMRSWSNVAFTTADGTKIRCQVARVKVLRPWLDLGLLSDTDFRLGASSGLETLSDGAVPTNEGFAKGPMANVIEEIVLVRRVQDASIDSGHPLGRFEYPEAINLIAFIVRSLPAISAKEAP